MSLSGQARGLVSEKASSSGGQEELERIGLLEMLAQDPRPTFILDFSATRGAEQPPIVYRNPALHSHFALNELISGRVIGHSDLTYIRFRDCVLHQKESGKLPYAFGGTSWTAYNLRSKYRVISGHLQDHVEPVPAQAPTQEARSETSIQASNLENLPDDTKRSRYDDGEGHSVASTERHAFGCTDSNAPEDRFSPFVQFFRSVDWASTILGPMDEWPLQLHQMCNFVMNDPTPAYVLWGKDLSVIYNEAAIQVILDRHPRCMGMPLQEVYPEVWDQISILIRKAQKTGKAVRVEDVPMLLKRHGRMEEMFFSFQYQPITDENGAVVGIYEPFVDVTKQNHTARNLSLLLEISACSSAAKNISEFWRLLLKALDTSIIMPFAMLYTVEDEEHTASSDNTVLQTRFCALEGQLGVPDDHVSFVKRVDLLKSDGYGPAMRKAMETGETVFLSTQEGSLSEDMVAGINLRGINTPSNTVVVWPICPTGIADTIGFLIMGLSPHLGVDEAMKGILDILIRQIATSVAAVMLLEEEVRNKEHVAQQLDVRTKELLQSEQKFQRMANNSLVGIVTCDPLGNLTYANQAFYDITGHPGGIKTPESWMTLFPDDVLESIKNLWAQLHAIRKPVYVEYPLKKSWTKEISRSEILKGPTWIIISAFVEEDEDGNLKGSVATVTDISQQKWAEEHQKRRMEEAMELKRQQEAFVDMTSHEIRNPLSAIIQSADSISSSLSFCLSQSSKDSSTVSISREILEDYMDAADTITLCAQHQKSVVDDILTLSKMDADMLMVTPVNVEPLKIVQHVVKMFETESTKHDISVKVDVEPSFYELGLSNVRLDPSRLTQVLVNIFGNAIKFTRVVTERRITIRVGGSLEDPDDSESGIEYIRPNETTIPTAFMDGSSTGSRMSFMRIAVRDTGPGLKPRERERLFKRFGQASPRTEVEYGGSGLGLFISKKLSELQGGGIGLASEPGHGSTFAFYILVQRSTQASPPPPLTIAPRTLELPHRSIELLTAPRPSPPVFSGPTQPRPSGLNATQLMERKLSILVVEDNLVNQRVLCKQLRHLGHTVHAANHGLEALLFLERSSFWIPSGEPLDIMLLDTEMPVMDGLTCARRIREAEASGKVRGHVPIVSVTANARSEQVEIARGAGMDDAISKPFRVADLMPKMYELVRRFGTVWGAGRRKSDG